MGQYEKKRPECTAGAGSRNGEDKFREDLKKLAGEFPLRADREEDLLAMVHQEIRERRKGMRAFGNRKGKILAAAAVIAVLGVGTALASGRIALLVSHVRTDQVDYQSAAEVEASEKLDKKAKAVEKFSNGVKFQQGFYSEVAALDESGAQVGSYPSITVNYSGEYFLDISSPITGVESGLYPVALSEETEGVSIEVSTMEYLFLPPDATPSAEDQKAKEEGRLEISYGSSQEERKTYVGANWEEDGLHYNLMTMKEGADPQELLEMAKEIVQKE